jgi:hypothetical protein
LSNCSQTIVLFLYSVFMVSLKALLTMLHYVLCDELFTLIF